MMFVVDFFLMEEDMENDGDEKYVVDVCDLLSCLIIIITHVLFLTSYSNGRGLGE
jgi:hypothetical protein